MSNTNKKVIEGYGMSYELSENACRVGGMVWIDMHLQIKKQKEYKYKYRVTIERVDEKATRKTTPSKGKASKRYRYLRKGEAIKAGDEYTDGFVWKPVFITEGDYAGGDRDVRRPIKNKKTKKK